MNYGYARVSSIGQAKDGFGLEVQKEILKNSGTQLIYCDIFTGMEINRPELDKLMKVIKTGDTFTVVKMDRLARTAKGGLAILDSLLERGVIVNLVQNGGIIDISTPNGMFMRTILLALAELERNNIVQRLQEGKAIAKLNPEYREGRKPTHSKAKIQQALKSLTINGGSMSYKQVQEIFGVSKSTLIREMRSNEK